MQTKWSSGANFNPCCKGFQDPCFQSSPDFPHILVLLMECWKQHSMFIYWSQWDPFIILSCSTWSLVFLHAGFPVFSRHIRWVCCSGIWCFGRSRRGIWAKLPFAIFITPSLDGSSGSKPPSIGDFRAPWCCFSCTALLFGQSFCSSWPSESCLK